MKPALRLLLALNGVDAGMTLALVTFNEAQELNPMWAWALRISPWLFLVPKLALVDTLGLFLARRDDKMSHRTLWGIAAAYLALILYQVFSLP